MRTFIVLFVFVLIVVNAVYAPMKYRQYALDRLALACRTDENTSYFATLSPAARSACESFMHGNAKAFEPHVAGFPEISDVLFGVSIAALLGAYVVASYRRFGSSDLLLFGAFALALILTRLGRWEAWDYYAAIKLSTIH